MDCNNSLRHAKAKQLQESQDRHDRRCFHGTARAVYLILSVARHTSTPEGVTGHGISTLSHAAVKAIYVLKPSYRNPSGGISVSASPSTI